MVILGIIPARGGSKGIKDKNICPINGKPLIAYTIEAALACKEITHLVISTDSLIIAKTAQSFGVPVPQLRPAHLATDEAKSIDVIGYEIENFEKNNKLKVDYVILLQPTSPLRTKEDISGSIAKFLKDGTQSLISCYDAVSVHPNIMYKNNGDILTPFVVSDKTRRQDFERFYVRNGAIYLATRDLVINEGRLICDNPGCFLMTKERSVNIDETFDLEFAQWMMSRDEK